jgi:hypothetical protein
MNVLAVKLPDERYAHFKILVNAVVRKTVAVAQSAARIRVTIVVQAHQIICGPVLIAEEKIRGIDSLYRAPIRS